MNSQRSWWVLALLSWSCGQETERRVATAPLDTTVAELQTQVGEVDGAPEYAFGDVSSVAIGESGRLYVADRIGSTVRAYDFSGRFLATIGSEGRGPGEFEFPNDLAFDADGRLYVRDYSRIVVFAAAVEGAIPDSLVHTVSLGGVSSPWSARGRVVGATYYRPNYIFRNGERLQYFYVAYDSTGRVGDTIRVPSLPNLANLGPANYPIRAELGRNLNGVNRAPFEPTAVWDMTPRASLISSPGDRNEIVEWGPGNDTVGVIRLGEDQRPVPPMEFDDSGRAFHIRLDSIPVPLDQVRGMSATARSGQLPRVLPAVLALHVAANGDMWLRRWPPAHTSDQAIFDVLDNSGVPRRTVVIPRSLAQDPPPFVSRQFVAGVVIDHETGTERIAVYRIPDRE
jgi:hypothetical protein